MSEKEESKICDTDESADVNDVTSVKQSNSDEASPALTVSGSLTTTNAVTVPSQEDISASYDFTDEDIENFFSDKPYTSNVNVEPECSHVSSVEPIPPSGIDIKAPCAECGSDSDNWICLTCYKIYCSRYVNEHMLQHTQSTTHPIVLSFYDVSIWCYGCDDFVEHRKLNEPRDLVIHAKYGSPTEGLTS